MNDLPIITLEVERMKVELNKLQARLDEIMFEYCPEEMTKEQLAEYEKSVKVVDK